MFFDNLQVTHTRGRLIEENHYYPFGLVMAGISCKILSLENFENKKKFNEGSELQNKEFGYSFGLEWYDVKMRFYDSQLGRFMQVDPEPDEENQEIWGPYQYGLDNPFLINDPDGKIWNNVVGGLLGGLVEVGTQLISKQEVTDWNSVGVAVLEGALSSGGSAIRRAIVSGGVALVKSGLSYSETNGGIKSTTDLINVTKNAVIDKIVDKVSGGLAKGVTGNILQKRLEKVGNSVMISKTQVIKNLSSSFTGKQKQAISKSIVNGQKSIAKNIRELPQNTIDLTTKILAKKKIDAVKKQTDL